MTSQVKPSRSIDAASSSFAPHKLWRSLRLYPLALSIIAAALVVVLVVLSSGSGSLSASHRSQRPQPVGGSLPQPHPQPQPQPSPTPPLRIPVRRVPVDQYPQFAAARRARLAEPFFIRDRVAAGSPPAPGSFDESTPLHRTSSAESTLRRKLLQDGQIDTLLSSSTAAGADDSSTAESASSSAAEVDSSSAPPAAASDSSSTTVAAESSDVVVESSSGAAASSSATDILSSSGANEPASDGASSTATTVASSSSSSSAAAVPAVAASSTGSAPSGLPLSTTAAGSHGRVHLRDYSDYMYIGVIGVGTPPQYFGCVFDTGSADTWVFSSSLPQSLHHPWLHYFQPSLSSTFVPVGSKWEISYGKGSARGQIQSDSVWVGGLEVANQHFGLATSADASTFSLQSEPIDGLMGLGFQGLATPGFGPTVIENALDRGVVDRRAFVFHMQPSNEDPVEQDTTQATASNAGATQASPGTLDASQSGQVPAGTLDEIATDRVDAAKHPASYFQLGDPTSPASPAAGAAASDMAPLGWSFTPIIPPHEVDGRWVVEMGGLAADSKDLPDFCSAASGASKPCFSWVDTGSSFVLLPADKFEAIMGSIIARRPDCSISAREAGSVDQKVICSWGWTTHLLPTLAFRFGSGSPPAAPAEDAAPQPPPEEFLLTPSQYALPTTIVDSSGAESEVLLLGFSPRANGASAYDEIILGDTFLKNYATLFDMGPRPVQVPGQPLQPDGMQGRIGFARGAGPWVVGWGIVVAVMGATVALMAAALWMVRRKHAGRVEAEAAAIAAAAGVGVGAAGPIVAPPSLPVSARLFGRSRDRSVLDDAGEGEARPRGYAQVSAVGGGMDAEEGGSTAGSRSLAGSGRDLESGSAAHPSPLSSAYDAAPMRPTAVELSRLAPAATSSAARPPSPSQLTRLSSDERAAMEEL